MQRIYISDTNIWSHFRHADLLAELFALPLTLASTDFVLFELPEGEADLLIGYGLQIETLDSTEISQLEALKKAHGNSATADVSCYLAASKRQRPLLTGDGQLRKQAEKDGLEVRGALWLLDQLVANGIIATAHAAAALQAMLDAGARLPPAECANRLTSWLA